ncbi:MAG: aminotransferase class I/II-fold pyridoxal phosphate-dependent enzyme [Butyrivibrio sp.]|nr:aminotransferase class I/II-fold pyridoxal phosphate-dependent enzyme [Butyrivibrio sp.]
MLHGGEIYGQKIEYDFSVNLNPYPCPEQVKRAVIYAAEKIDLYPDIQQTAFRKAVAASEGCDLSYENIIGGNGASELLVSALRYINPKRVLMPVPSFYGYRHALNMLDKCVTETYLLLEQNDYALDDGFIEKITDDIDAVIIANPNNPTGRCIDEKRLDAIIKKCVSTNTFLVIDECFLKLSCGNSAKRYIGCVPKLIVIDAYTKLFSIPGVRVGYAIADEKDITGIRRYLPEWNLSVFAEKAGIICAQILMDDSYVEKSLEMIRKGREQLCNGFNALDMKVYKSYTNFILIKSNRNLQDVLLEHGILIRDCSNFEGLSKGYYRIAVKDEENNQRLLDACK